MYLYIIYWSYCCNFSILFLEVQLYRRNIDLTPLVETFIKGKQKTRAKHKNQH